MGLLIRMALTASTSEMNHTWLFVIALFASVKCFLVKSQKKKGKKKKRFKIFITKYYFIEPIFIKKNFETVKVNKCGTIHQCQINMIL